MANNDDHNPRRYPNRIEDNPFIAFRRFTDSHVSSLLNTVFTLPATLVTLNNAHHARGQCLFGKADAQDCQKLGQLEQKVAYTRSIGVELYQKGDLETVIKKGEELLKLDQEANQLRKKIVEDARRGETDKSRDNGQTELVERVAREKGQQWGWSWSWGFPASFHEEERAKLTEDRQIYRGNWSHCQRPSREQMEEERQRRKAKWESFKKQLNEELPRAEQGESQKVSWRIPIPPPADAPTQANPNSERQTNLFDELGHMIMDEVTRLMLPSSFSSHQEEYSPRALENNQDLKKAGVPWRDAFEDLVRSVRGAPLIPSEKLGSSEDMSYDRWTRRFWDREHGQRERKDTAQYPKPVPWEGEETSEEPSYEYAHDHEDQHDEPPSPKVAHFEFPATTTATVPLANSVATPATELEAYERLLRPTGPTTEPKSAVRTSLLSTLTTTERTVAPDGTTTTKVVLKKRFADGREESSETVHTQRGQETDSSQDPWKALKEPQFPSPTDRESASQELAKKDAEKKKGWFWSG
ncbi:hypothetical protein K504DRAFT_486146 [Pleomassaria siparia CBS 279.74]|uniref:Uncharacterized protein n=1 Tax=Pleomassaria siparia CBS 279.74 TaxID=1314801 RepID=A0A6G1JRA4_9PLEO|nr:hypothetical protein K504DRAFT_486146 [Pleomassaria siparia CBS 279.74]